LVPPGRQVALTGATNEQPPGGQPGDESVGGVELNRAAALAQADDPAVALRAVDRLDLDGYLYFHSTRGELLRRLGRDAEARAAYGRALELATTTPERRFLTWQLDQL
jgi:RNA polymerase sigma-70 factor, ECF subfamily